MIYFYINTSKIFKFLLDSNQDSLFQYLYQTQFVRIENHNIIFLVAKHQTSFMLGNKSYR